MLEVLEGEECRQHNCLNVTVFQALGDSPGLSCQTLPHRLDRRQIHVVVTSLTAVLSEPPHHEHLSTLLLSYLCQHEYAAVLMLRQQVQSHYGPTVQQFKGAAHDRSCGNTACQSFLCSRSSSIIFQQCNCLII